MRMKEFFFDRETNTVVAGTSEEELQDDLYLDDQYAEMYGVSCSLENCEISSQKKMQFDLSKMFNLELIPDSNNILADDSGSTETALTGISAVTQIMEAGKGGDDHSKIDKADEMKDDDDEDMEKLDESKSENDDNYQKDDNTKGEGKKDKKEENNANKEVIQDDLSVMSCLSEDPPDDKPNPPDDIKQINIPVLPALPNSNDEDLKQTSCKSATTPPSRKRSSKRLKTQVTPERSEEHKHNPSNLKNIGATDPLKNNNE